MAVFTAVLAGIFSVVGSYFTTQIQTKYAIVQKQLEYRAQSYLGFLEKVDRSRSPVLSQILNIGSLAERVATDSEIQNLEDHLADIFKKADIQDIYWQLNSDLNVLRLHGSTRVRRMCDDILKALSLRDFEIDWSSYSAEVSQFYAKWRDAQRNGIPYGWEPKISDNERLMVVVIGKLFDLLIGELRNELQTQSPTFYEAADVKADCVSTSGRSQEALGFVALVLLTAQGRFPGVTCSSRPPARRAHSPRRGSTAYAVRPTTWGGSGTGADAPLSRAVAWATHPAGAPGRRPQTP
jgi:hypothetical protein